MGGPDKHERLLVALLIVTTLALGWCTVLQVEDVLR